VAAALSSAQIQSDLSTGIITSISTQALAANAFLAGDLLAVVDTTTGSVLSLTVTADVEEGDTTVAVTGYAVQGYASGAPIIYLPQNQTIQANVASGGSSTAALTLSDIQAFFAQFVWADSTNDASWRIEIPNVVFETDENAGNGSTAGLRMDGAGLIVYESTSAEPVVEILPTGNFEFKTSPITGTTGSGIKIESEGGIYSYKSTSSTPVFHLKNTGIFLLNHNAHPTVEANIFYVFDGVIYLDFDGAGTKVHPQFGHIKSFCPIDFATPWTVGTKHHFLRVTQEYAGLELWKIGVGCGNSAGSGAGTNAVSVNYQDAAGSAPAAVATVNTIASGQNADVNTASIIQTLSTGDLLYITVDSIKASAPEGLFVDMYFRKT
jgi:hypothetical protein